MSRRVKPAAKAAEKQPSKPWQATACHDHNRHTCIEVSRVGGVVRYIPLDILGFDLLEAGEEKFDAEFKPIADYPVDRAARLYVEYATILGGSQAAMSELAKLTKVTEKEMEMAVAKKAAKAVDNPAAKTAAKKTAAKKTAAPKGEGGKRHSAAQMFKDLIMEGKKTDDQIFAAVQKEFGLDDNKRGYVKWYRNDMTKKGLKPPAAKA